MSHPDIRHTRLLRLSSFAFISLYILTQISSPSSLFPIQFAASTTPLLTYITLTHSETIIRREIQAKLSLPHQKSAPRFKLFNCSGLNLNNFSGKPFYFSWGSLHSFVVPSLANCEEFHFLWLKPLMGSFRYDSTSKAMAACFCFYHLFHDTLHI